MTANRLKPYVPERKKKPSHRERLKRSVTMKGTPLEDGLFAVASPLPMFFATVLWSWFIFFGICLGLLRLNSIPNWALIVMLLPLLFSPALGVLGIVHSLKKIKEKYAWLGLLLSIFCLAENACLLYVMGYLGTIA